MDEFQLSLPERQPLPDSQIKDLIRQAQTGDEQARQELIETNLRLVMSIIGRFRHRGFDMEDLFQVGSIGLVKAIDQFNLEFDVRFSTYAVPKIIGEIKRYIRESSPIRVSRSLKELASKAIQAKDELTARLGRSPTVSELAEHLEIAKEQLVTALDAVAPVQSLHQVIHEDEGTPVLLEDQIAVQDNYQPEMLLKEVIKQLDPEERRLLMLRYFAEKSQSEVAATLGISQAQVSRIEKRILQQIRKEL